MPRLKFLSPLFPNAVIGRDSRLMARIKEMADLLLILIFMAFCSGGGRFGDVNNAAPAIKIQDPRRQIVTRILQIQVPFKEQIGPGQFFSSFKMPG
jgi:hypothetical protein